MDTECAASVVIPAHNEESVIGRLLSVLPNQVDGRPLQIVVACNGCTDDTAGVARRHGATVIEIEESSKIAALNAGDAVAGFYPRLYVDADIEITSRAIEDLVRTLSVPGALCAAPPSKMQLEGRPLLVRAYLSFWRQLMLEREGYVGAGVYALSREGRGRFGKFPDVIADDTFVRNLFSRSERALIPTDPTVIEAPRTVGALLRRRVRVSAGNIQLSQRAAEQPTPGSLENRIRWWRVALGKPTLLPQALVYASFNALARIGARRRAWSGRAIHWGRDETTRATSK